MKCLLRRNYLNKVSKKVASEGLREKKNPKTEGTKAGLFKDHWGSQCVREETSKTVRPKSSEMGEVVKVG